MYGAIFGCKAVSDPRQTNKSSNDASDDVVLLRHDISEFTPAEIDTLTRIDLPDELESPPPTTTQDHHGNTKMNRMSANNTLHSRRCGGPACTLQELLPREGRVGGTDSMADTVLDTTQLHVDGRGLRNTTAVECFLNLTHLYMQHNEITTLDGITLLQHLSVLVVHHNRVRTLRPLVDMHALIFIDARYNAIAVLDPLQDLPTDTLRYLALLGNPCAPPAAADVDSITTAGTNTIFATAVDSTNTDSTGRTVETREAYRHRIVECCPLLEVLDDEPCQPSSSSSSCTSSTSGEEEDEEANESERPLSILQRISTSHHSHPNSTEHSSILRSRLVQSLRLSKTTSAVSLSEPLPSALAQLRDEHAAVTERLCQQLQHRFSSIRRIAGCHASDPVDAEETTWSIEDATAGSSHRNGGHYRMNHSVDYDRDAHAPLPHALQQEREIKSRLYEDIHFALHTDQARLQQLVENAWEDVENVLRTRHALVSQRRARMAARQQQPSDAYKESLALLQKEGQSEDLDRYRN